MRVCPKITIHALFTVLFTLSSTLIIAQPGRGKKQNNQTLAAATELLEKSSYYNAIEILENAVAKDPGNIRTIYMLADTYYKSRDYVNAADYLGLLLGAGDPAVYLNFPLIQFQYADALKRTG